MKQGGDVNTSQSVRYNGPEREVLASYKDDRRENGGVISQSMD